MAGYFTYIRDYFFKKEEEVREKIMENILVPILLVVFVVLLARSVGKSKAPTEPKIGGGGSVDTDADADDDIIKIDGGPFAS